MSKPIAVISGDIHFTPGNLELATAVVKQMQAKASELDVPMILNGDTLDSKAIMRAECVNRLLELLPSGIPTYVNVGNHERLNEKSPDHCLRFVKRIASCSVIDCPTYLLEYDLGILPYYSDPKEFIEALRFIPKDSILVVHQGVESANLGHYASDASALPREVFRGRRVIGSHYHRRQDIDCGAGGLFSYVGSPYTQSFGEANDGAKGFSVLYADGSLEFVPTRLREHVIMEVDAKGPYRTTSPGNLLWLKVRGTASELALLDKVALGNEVIGHANYKLDKICTTKAEIIPTKNKLSDLQILDNLITSIDESETRRTYLKTLARELLNENPETRS